MGKKRQKGTSHKNGAAEKLARISFSDVRSAMRGRPDPSLRTAGKNVRVVSGGRCSPR